ncbi:JAB domain-containing protein [Tamlana sp. 2201CG12-4]|uniref:JAB domain-containing protein n=1 Tax=Tamlana sp. 2201CG12-4 TaxID=3112582 RepID=UPI002DBC9034|nr:JAB domain-containing protein [Tamlana sp. 2201CG12-4]MEC3908892.1 JAB domain-containing protein [Tamlana sp. 2201CG12-4]
MKDKVNEISVSYKEKIRTMESKGIKSSEDAAKLFFESWNRDTIGFQETFKVLLLNNANKMKGVYQLSTGSLTGTMIDMRILFAVIIKTLSVGVILAHNHPSGQLKPSEADKRLTQKIQKASKFFDVNVLDHLIIVPNGHYYSFADNGLM